MGAQPNDYEILTVLDLENSLCETKFPLCLHSFVSENCDGFSINIAISIINRTDYFIGIHQHAAKTQ